METLPTGVVTFVMGDIERSITARTADRDVVSRAIVRLDSLVTDVCSDLGGASPVEQGDDDGFVLAFSRPSDAIACALRLQLAIGRDISSDDVPVRVRIGVHTGEAELRDDASYTGEAISRAARIRDLGHGGQTLVSGPAHALVGERLPKDAALADLGSHQLPGLQQAERIFELQHPGLPTRFPPLRSEARRDGNLPTPLSSFVGREVELAELADLLVSERVISLVGAGGCGKTRLAIALGAAVTPSFPGGAWFVDLASLSDPDAIGAAVASTIGHPDASADPYATIASELRESTLVILDNCEHMIDGAAAAAVALLDVCPKVTVVATSREPLGVAGETTWRVPSLSVPASEGVVDDVLSSDAGRLFVDRARRAHPGFTIDEENASEVVSISRRLEGMPLAIELAAARVRHLSPGAIASGLDDCLRVLSGGARTSVPRHQTLRASVEWSFRLLSTVEQRVLRRLSVFAGGFDLDAAETVAACDETVDAHEVFDAIALLVDRSLVIADHDSDMTRYRLLEPVRQFAADQASAEGDLRSAREAHLAHWIRVVDSLERALERDVQSARTTVRREWENIAAALNWADASGDGTHLVRLVNSLVFYFGYEAQHRDAMRWIARALREADDVDPLVRVQLLLGSAYSRTMTGDAERAIPEAEQAMELANDTGDARAIAWASQVLNVACVFSGLPPASPAGLEAVLLMGPDAVGPSVFFWAVDIQASTLIRRGRYEEAAELLETWLPRCRTDGLEGRVVVFLMDIAVARAEQGRLDDAIALLNESVAESRTTATSWTPQSTAVLAGVVRRRGDPMHAIALAEEALAGFAREGQTHQFRAWAHFVIGMAARDLGDLDRAEHQLTAAIEIMEAGGVPAWLQAFQTGLADVLRCIGDKEAARGLLAAAIADATNEHNHRTAVDGALRLAFVALDEGSVAEAEDLAHDALARLAEWGAWLAVIDAIELLAAAASIDESPVEAARLVGAADAARLAMGYPRPEPELAEHGKTLAAIGDVHDDALAEGRALSLDDAVAYARRGRGERGRPSSGWRSLTPTERQVVELVVEGLSNPEIAERLFVSRATVKTHLSHVYAKLGIGSRTELVATALRR